MTARPTFSCVLFGNDSLTMECGDLLLARGHAVCAIVTSAPRVRSWARAHGLDCLDAGGDYAGELAQRARFDWLFSIAYLSLIPPAALMLPARGAINFHDGPLPRYAGLNAPVWAILNGEREHGIAWHFVTAGLDEGAILLQRKFPIADDDTALSLNTRCFEAGLESFGELVDKLAAGDASARPQDATARSYFGRHQRPAAMGVLDWRRAAAELERVVRALDHGRYANPLTAPKVAHNAAALIAAHARVAPGSGVPGTVLSSDAHGVTVACGEGALLVSEFRGLCGEPVAPAAALERLGAAVGDTLRGPDDVERERLTALEAKTCRHETYWTERLLTLDPPALPWPAPVAAGESGTESAPLKLPAALAQFNADQRVAAILGAFGASLARLCGRDEVTLGFSHDGLDALLGARPPYHSPRSLLELRLAADEDFAALRTATATAVEAARSAGTWSADLPARHPGLRGRPALGVDGALGLAVELRARPESVTLGGHDALVLAVAADGSGARLVRDRARVSAEAAERIRRACEILLSRLCATPAALLRELDLLDDEEVRRVVEECNRTEAPAPTGELVHEAIVRRAGEHPDRTALTCGGRTMTWGELDRRSAALAARLAALGAGPDVPVGIHVRRAPELVVAVLGVLRANAAYLPLDPEAPRERVATMAADARLGLVVTERATRAELTLPDGAQAVDVDGDLPGASAPVRSARLDSLAYVIYTSGSTGRPKGVMVEHRNVVNLFAAMDARVPHDPPGRWLAVTGLSFDISALELLWTLGRGFEVEIAAGPAVADSAPAPSSRPIDFGIFVWGSDDAPGPSKYELLLGAARFGDEHGFSSIWMPERHFHAFGGQYPNPAVTAAAVAAVTRRIAIRSGSIVTPLHHPLRIAEEWAVVDNLSNGRVGLGIASGWWPDDFVLRPESFADKKNRMQRDADLIRRLWRGEAVAFPRPDGQLVAKVTQPRPVQKEVPLWLTSAGNPETFVIAGHMGVDILTHLLGQSVDEVAEKIRLYRKARAEAGHDPAGGVVTLMLHACVGDDVERVRELVRGPLKGYLASATMLVKKAAWNFPAFKRPEAPDAGLDDIDIDALTGEEVDAVLEHAFQRYFEDSGLFGTPESVQPMVERLKEIGVNEIGCLVDFGLPAATVLAHLEPLARALRQANAAAPAAPRANARPTHMQCTPSRARALLLAGERELLAGLQQLLIGGEAFPPALARELATVTQARLLNVYGPTETTIWSSAYEVVPGAATIPIGTPLANTRFYVLDAHRRPLPPGVPGELYIAGAGVARGYLGRPDLTAERFLPDPFRPGQRMYATGDRALLRADGVFECLGRNDHQVKVRGHRVELGEIETALETHPRVAETVVVAGPDPGGETRLVAYFTRRGTAPEERDLREHLRARLPSPMVPAHFVRLDELPLTPNGKVDRKALPDPETVMATAGAEETVAPQGELQDRIAACWRRVLGRDHVGARANFFDVGGHSLLMLRLQLLLKESLGQRISLTDLYRFPTVQGLATHLESGGSGDEALNKSEERAAQRRSAMQGRRPRT